MCILSYFSLKICFNLLIPLTFISFSMKTLNGQNDWYLCIHIKVVSIMIQTGYHSYNMRELEIHL